MKKVLFLLVMAMLFAGCEYEVPVSGPQGLKIDKSLLGLWKQSELKKGEDAPDSLLVIEFSDEDYLVAYTDKDTPVYFKAYPVEIEGKKYVQTQLIGSGQESAPDEYRKFQLITYNLEDKQLELYVLNANVVDSEISDSETLRKQFIAKKDNAKLFNGPIKFVKVEPKK
jgi:hypothetical protein